MVIHAIFIPLALPATLLLLALLLRLVRFLWFHYKQAGFPPIIIHAGNDADSSAFAALLSAYLARDTLDADIVIPPGGRGAGAAYPVERLDDTVGWLATIIRVVLAAEPAFEVHVQYVRARETELEHRAIVRVTRAPGNRVVVATTIWHKSEEYLVRRVGCAIGHSIRQTRIVRAHTPRWERWSPELDGYLEYRWALDSERLGKTEYGNALRKYDEAISHEPGNFMISMRKAALLEVMGEYEQAAEVYRTCNELWPENIEAAYRLAAVFSNDQHHDEAYKVLTLLEKRLRRRILWSEWIKTWRITRWNVGERRYWRHWLRRSPIVIGTNKRMVFKNAIKIGKLAPGADEPVPPGKDAQTTDKDNAVSALLEKVARLTTRPSLSCANIRIFHPDLPREEHQCGVHNPNWHTDETDKDLGMYPTILHVKPKARIGWLAHYNAAIFFSIALEIPKEKLPSGYNRDDWKVDCARAAIRELGYVKRDPRSELEADWYRTDPGLRPLREYCEERAPRWSDFVGLARSETSSGLPRMSRTGA